MNDYLVDHAMKNVWCTPNQDMQANVKLARLTGYGGAWNTFRVLRRTIALPEQGPRFHVYQIGGIHPYLLGLLQSDRMWTSMTDACNGTNLIADLYVNSGIQLMRSQCYYMVTPDKDLILAAKVPDKIPVDLNTEALYLRVYSNAYFGSTRYSAQDDYVKVVSAVPRDTAEILALQGQYRDYSNRPGLTYGFVNGVKVSSIDLVSVKPEDNVEFVYDSSIQVVVDLPVKDLVNFTSLLDNKNKYLLHYPGHGSMMIDYFDDIDIFLIKTTETGRHKGLYYHRNTEDAIRMLTHKDYAIPVAHVLGYLNSPIGWTDEKELTVRLHIRKGGYDRPLVDETNRIKELYKLPDDRLVEAMVGLNAVVPNWTAANLELSAYTKIMRSEIIDVTKQMVEDAYGYNAISKLIADTPRFVETINGQPGVKVPHGLFTNSTAYEYDENGKLLGWNPHPVGTAYFPYAAGAKLVEMVTGLADNFLDEVFGLTVQMLNPSYEYRMYICDIIAGAPNNKWRDVTGSSMYAVIDDKLTWLIDNSRYYTMVRSNERMLGYDIKLPMTDGVLKFSLNQYQTRNGERARWVAQVPQGEYDFWLNGNSLVEGVDYIFNFPEIVIISKRYLINPATQEQRVTVRGMGFCNASLMRSPVNDRGFIEYGLLSHNNRFDIRDDKVNRIVVAGKTMHRSQLKFSEDHAAIIFPEAMNGSPYMVRDIVVPLRGKAVSDTYDLRAESMQTDKAISDYLSVFLPEPQPATPNTIPALYPLYTPFLSKLIHDLRSGVLNDPILTTDYNDNEVMEVCKPYEGLLRFDPTQIGLRPDPNYTIIHPHNENVVLDVTMFQYRFLMRVINIYMKDSGVNLSSFLSLTTS